MSDARDCLDNWTLSDVHAILADTSQITSMLVWS